MADGGWPLWVVALATSAMFLFHALLLSPLARRAMQTASAETLARRSAWLLAADASKLVWLMLAISAILTWGILAIVTSLTGATPDAVSIAIERIATVRGWITSLEAWGSILLLALATAVLLYWIYRRSLRQSAGLSEELRKAQLEALLRQAQDGTLPELEPDERMSQIAGAIEIHHNRETELDAAVAAAQDEPERARAMNARERARDDLKTALQAYLFADLERRIVEPGVERLDAEVEPAARTPWQRIGRFFISRGLIRDLSGLQRLALAANLLLAIPTVLVAAQADIGATLDGRIANLSALRVNLLASEEQQRLEQAVAKAENKDPPNPSEDDVPENDDFDPDDAEQVQQTANAVGRLFEKFAGEVFIRHVRGGPGGGWPHGEGLFKPGPMAEPTAEETKAILANRRDMARYETRKRVLDAMVVTKRGPSPGSPSGIYVDPDPRPPVGPDDAKIPGLIDNAPEIADALADAKGKPVTVGGRRVAQSIPSLAQKQPTAYRAIARSISQYGEVARTAQVTHVILSEILGGASEGLASDILAPETAKWVEATIDGPLRVKISRAMSESFLARLIETRDIAKAFEAVDRVAHASLATTEMSALKPLIEASLPDDAALAGEIRDRLPGLRQKVNEKLLATQLDAVNDVVTAQLKASGQLIDDALRVRVSEAAVRLGAVQGFEDFFPPNMGSGGGGGGGGGKGVRPSVAPSSVSRARSFRILRGSARVGGVLIGQEPDPQSIQLDFNEFRWERKQGGMVLTLVSADGKRIESGPFRPSIVHLALGYAADGRPLTVTMTTAEPLSELKILLHPALLDTALGCRAIKLDRFVDEATGSDEGPTTKERTAKSMAAYAEGALYELARLAVVEALEPALRAAVLRVSNRTIGVVGSI